MFAFQWPLMGIKLGWQTQKLTQKTTPPPSKKGYFPSSGNGASIRMFVSPPGLLVHLLKNSGQRFQLYQ